VEIQQGWLAGAERCPSPNCDRRPEPAEISLLVIHNISLPPGEFGGGRVREFFCNRLDCNSHPYFDRLRDIRVSAHLLIERGGKITQFVSCEDRAWHAGVSSFEGRAGCNDFSVGIELEGTDRDAYTEAQYAVLVRATRALMGNYPAITAARIAGHSDIAPGRKSDPGPAFDWAYYFSGLNGGDRTP